MKVDGIVVLLIEMNPSVTDSIGENEQTDGVFLHRPRVLLEII